MRAGKFWGIEDATAWLYGHAWGGEVLRRLQLAENAEQREQWLWVVVAMRAVLERSGRDAARVAINECTDIDDPAGIAPMAAHLDER